MKKTFHFSILLFLTVIALSSFRSKPVLQNTLRSAIGDTASFIPNKSENWNMISAYLNQYTSDSVEFEIILTRTGLANIGGANESFIGTITTPLYRPLKTQKVTYQLLVDNVWEIKISNDGQCFLRQIRGSAIGKAATSDNAAVLPIKIRYKNK